MLMEPKHSDGADEMQERQLRAPHGVFVISGIDGTEGKAGVVALGKINMSNVEILEIITRIDVRSPAKGLPGKQTLIRLQPGRVGQSRRTREPEAIGPLGKKEESEERGGRRY